MDKRLVCFVGLLLLIGSMSFLGFMGADSETKGKPAPKWQVGDYWLYIIEEALTIKDEIPIYNDSNQNGEQDEATEPTLGTLTFAYTHESYYDKTTVEQVFNDLQKYKAKWDYSYWLNGTWSFTPTTNGSSAPYNFVQTDGTFNYHEWTNAGTYAEFSIDDISIVGANYNFGFECKYVTTTSNPGQGKQLFDLSLYSYQGTETDKLAVASGKLQYLKFPISLSQSWPFTASTKVDWSGTVNYYNAGQTESYAGNTARNYNINIVVGDTLETRTIGELPTRSKQITDNYKLKITGKYDYIVTQTSPKPATNSGTRNIDMYRWYSPTVGYWVSYNNSVNLTDYKYTPNIPVIFKEKEQYKEFDVFEGQEWTKIVSAEDPDVQFGDVLTFDVSITPAKEWINITKQTDTDAELKINKPPQADVGDYTVSVSVSDSFGEKDTLEFIVHVKNKNDAPYVNKKLADITLFENSKWDGNSTYGKIKLSDVFSDPDLENPAFGDSLTYSVTGNSTVQVTIDKATTEVSFIVPDKVLAQPTMKLTMTFEAKDNGCGKTEDILSAKTTLNVTLIHVNHAPYVDPKASEEISFSEDTTKEIKLNTVFKDDDELQAGLGEKIEYLEPEQIDETQVKITIDKIKKIAKIVPNKDWNGEEEVTFKAKDSYGEIAEYKVKLVVTPVNDKPEIKEYAPEEEEITIKENEKQKFSVSAIDVDGDTITYEWYIGDELQEKETKKEFTFTSTYNGDFSSSGGEDGVFEIKVIVKDKTESVEQVWSLEVVNVNRAPKAVITTPFDGTKVTSGKKILFDGANSSDEDEEDKNRLQYEWSSNIQGVLSSNPTFEINNLKVGKHVITLIVRDGKEASTATINVTITPKPKPAMPGFEFVALGLAVIAVVAVLAYRKK
ncbi:MAG: hypothetical protein AB1779_00060 [Candidatus Thermoplasmatota archaeon]